MKEKEAYNKDEVIRQLMELAANLDNGISEGISKGENDMPKRLTEKVTINGHPRWVHGYSVQELFDNYVKLMVNEGLIEWVEEDDAVPIFGKYLKEFYRTFKQGQQSNTVVNRERTIRNHIEPAFGSKRILLCYTGMRFEEVLGVRCEDISFNEGFITVRRAVVHPNRNMPEVKCPKTKTSERRIPMCDELALELNICQYRTGFILHTNKDKSGETPLSYTEARRSFDKIRKKFDILDYTAHDFRDTCATEWRENGMPLDMIARILGHSKTETTEKRYVKYRGEMIEKARNMM